MKASFFEPIRYIPPQKMPAQWPMPPGFYDPEVGVQTFQGTIERLQFVEELGFDWVSFSEHHYGARILTPSPIVMASHIAAHLHNIKIAVAPAARPQPPVLSVPCGAGWRPVARGASGTP